MILAVGLGSRVWRASDRQIAAVDFPLHGCPQITTSAMSPKFPPPRREREFFRELVLELTVSRKM